MKKETLALVLSGFISAELSRSGSVDCTNLINYLIDLGILHNITEEKNETAD